RRKAEQEAAQEAARRRAEQEAARKKAEHEAMLKAEAERIAKLRAEDQARQRKALQEAPQRRAADEEKWRKVAAEEEVPNELGNLFEKGFRGWDRDNPHIWVEDLDSRVKLALEAEASRQKGGRMLLIDKRLQIHPDLNDPPGKKTNRTG